MDQVRRKWDGGSCTIGGRKVRREKGNGSRVCGRKEGVVRGRIAYSPLVYCTVYIVQSTMYTVQYITIAGLQPLLSNITFNWYLSLRIWLQLNCQLLYLVNYVLPLHTLYTVKCDFYLFSVTCSFL